MSLTKELQSYPLLWKKITNGNSIPDVESMIHLLKITGFQVQNRPSGSICIKALFQYRKEIELYLKEHENFIEEKNSIEESLPKQTEEINLKNEEINIKNFPFDPDTQCESTLESEALERLKSCIATSFRTDAGIIMLENDLSMFEDQEDYIDWVKSMRSAWKDRLHSKISDEFNEALDLWVLSQKKI